MPTKVWLDTDIGTDVDDAVALSLALRSPEVELVGVSTVYGDVGLRSRMAAKMVALAGRGSIPVYSGCELPLLNERPVYWAGWEGEGLVDADGPGPRPEHAVDALVRAVAEQEGEITLVAVGPLTNVALAFIREPATAKRLRRLVIMGGLCRCGPEALGRRFAEHNIACDPEAAGVVFRAGAETVMVGLDVTLRVRITAEGIETIGAEGADPLRLALADQLRRYLRAVERDFTYMHDPLAMAYVIQPELLTLEPCDVLVDTRSEIAPGATWVSRNAGSHTQVALEVRAEEFETFLVERLSGDGTPAG